MKNGETDFDSLVGRIQATSEALQQDALVVINRSVTARAWLTGYLQSRFGQLIPVQDQKGYTLSSLLPAASAAGVVEKSQTASSLFDANQILMISGDDIRINPAALFNRLSYSHIYELLKMPVDIKQLFLSEYQLQLPGKEAFTEFLKKENEGLAQPMVTKKRKAKGASK